MMKYLVSTIVLFLLISTSLQAQWYHRQYGADKVGELSFYQLKQSTKRSVINIGVGTFSMAAGSLIMINGKEKLDPETNPSLFEIFQSPDARGYAIAGTIVFTTGAAIVLTNTVRLVIIGNARHKLFAQEMIISPTLLGGSNNMLSPGMTVIINF